MLGHFRYGNVTGALKFVKSHTFALASDAKRGSQTGVSVARWNKFRLSRGSEGVEGSVVQLWNGDLGNRIRRAMASEIRCEYQ
jgi:hypothetical protein